MKKIYSLRIAAASSAALILLLMLTALMINKSGLSVKYQDLILLVGQGEKTVVLSIIMGLGIILVITAIPAMLITSVSNKLSGAVGLVAGIWMSVDFLLMLTATSFVEDELTATLIGAIGGLFSGWSVVLLLVSMALAVLSGMVIRKTGQIEVPSVPIEVPSEIKEPPVTPMEPRSIQGICGMYANAVFPIVPGESIVIGRDAQGCNIVISENTDGVSRKHCELRLSQDGTVFEVTDSSSYGTRWSDTATGRQGLILKGFSTLSPGTVIELGSSRNSFLLQ